MTTTANVFNSYTDINGRIIYTVNGKKVSKEEYFKKQEASKQKRESVLGITDEKRKTETQSDRIKRMQNKLNKITGNKKGGKIYARGGTSRKPKMY